MTEIDRTDENEIWRDIPSYQGIYQAGSLGGVRRVFARTSGKANGIRKPHLTHDGYLRLDLYRDGIGRMRPVHQLVAEAFIGPKPDGMTVNHRDGVKTNNRPENLEYISGPENTRHAVRNGLRTAIGEKHHSAKLTDYQVIEIRATYVLGQRPTLAELGSRFGVDPSVIHDIVRGRKWKHLL